MKALIWIVSTIIFYGCGLLMWLFYIGALSDWLGFIGTISGVITAPGSVIFPFIYWIVEDDFPTLYFALWGIGLVAMFIGGLASED